MTKYGNACTVVVPSSFIPSHPSTHLIRTALKSIREVLSLPQSRLIIACDGLPTLPDEVERYAEYKQRVRAIGSEVGADVFELNQHQGLPGVIVECFRHVRTTCVLVFQHDFEALRSVDIDGICGALLQNRIAVNHIRLNHRGNQPRKADSILEPLRHPPLSVPLLRTSAWSDMPHFTTASYYREHVLPKLKPSGGRLGVENQMTRLLRRDIRELGFDRGQAKHGTFVYGQLNDLQVVRHLDGRRTRALDANSTESVLRK